MLSPLLEYMLGLPKEDEFSFITAAGPDDQFGAPKQCNTIPVGAPLPYAGKVLLATNPSAQMFGIRNPDLSFYSKYFWGAVSSIDADLSNIYIATAQNIYKQGYDTIRTLGPTIVVNSIRMIDFQSDPDYGYVTSNSDAEGHGVRKIRKSDMTVVASLLSKGTGDGQFTHPFGVKKYGDYVYVADVANARLVKLNASDLSFVENILAGQIATPYDLCTDGNYWYLNNASNVYKRNMDFSAVSSVATNAWSICLIPDQGDGCGQTLCVVSNSNSNIKRYKCSDLSLVATVGSSGDGTYANVDPVVSWIGNWPGAAWYTDDGKVLPVTSGANVNENGFASATHRNPGPHEWKLLNVPAWAITAITIDYDSIIKTSLKRLPSLTSLNVHQSSVVDMGIPTLDVSGCQYLYGNQVGLFGPISVLNRLIRSSIANNPGLTGSVADLPSTLNDLMYLYGCPGISAGSVAHLTLIRDLRILNMGWSQASVDIVLKSISDALHVNENNFTYAAPILQIGGTNAAPSNAVSGWHDPLITPGIGNSDANWQWDAKGALLGNAVGEGEKTWGSTNVASIYMYAGKFQNVNAGAIGHIKLKTNGAVNVKVAIYSDNSSAPDALLAYSNGFACVDGWNTIPLTTQVELSAGTFYWLALRFEVGAAKGRFNASGGVSRYMELAYADPFPATFGSGISGTVDWAISGWTSAHRAISGGAAIWAANHCLNHPWTIMFTGGESEASLLGNIIGTGEKTWTNTGASPSIVYAQKFTAVAGTIGDIRIRVNGSTNVKLAIYANNAGSPGALLAYSNSTPVVAGWNTVQLTTQVSLSAGDYWLALKVESSNLVQFALGVNGTSVYQTGHTYAAAFQDPFGSAAQQTPDFAIAGWGLKIV